MRKQILVPRVQQGSATELPYPDNFFDAVLTDPPYYINVPYADLSDFFYVWLKRTLGDLYPELFATPLTPKSEEICQMQNWDSERYAEKTKEWFEEMLTKAFSEFVASSDPTASQLSYSLIHGQMLGKLLSMRF
jgi:putative DNA methylase